MALFHVFSEVENKYTGVPMSGVRVAAKFAGSETTAPIYANENGDQFTPPNTCVTDSDGMYSFYIDSGNYDLEFYVGGKLVKEIPNYRPAEVGPSGPANSTYQTTAELENSDTANVSAILAEVGKAGTFTTRNYVDFTAEVATDAGKVNYIRSVSNPAIVWVRTSILSVGASQTGAGSGLTVDGELAAKATLTGVSRTATNMGAYASALVNDNQSAKQNIVDLAAATEARVPSADLASPDTGKGSDLVDFSHPASEAAKGFPAYNFRTQRRNLADFIEKDQWAAIRNGTATATATNGFGVDAYSAALSDIAGAVGGEIEIPDGLFVLPQVLVNQTNLTIRGKGESTILRTTSATAHQIDVTVPWATIADITFTSSTPRTAGACVRVRNSAPRFDCEGLVSFGAFTLLQIDGHPTDPSQDTGIFKGSRLRAFDTVQNGRAYQIGGGYLVNLDDIIQAGNPAVSALNGPASGLFVTRCADLRIGGNSQFLNCQRALDVLPSTGSTVASLRLEGGYFGTSYYGSRISCQNGGEVVSFQAKGSWFGENKNSGGGVTGSGNGLSLIGGGAQRFKQAVLEGCEFPLAQFNGLDCDSFMKCVQVIGGWADGCGGAGYSFNGNQDWLLMGTRSGSQRFAGNGSAYYIDGACDYFRVIGNDFRDNLSASGAPTPSATKIFSLNVG